MKERSHACRPIVPDDRGSPGVVGVLKVREHCAFAWLERGFHRIAIASSEHCSVCIAEVRRLGHALIRLRERGADGDDASPQG
jgi:hypothetical protein